MQQYRVIELCKRFALKLLWGLTPVRFFTHFFLGPPAFLLDSTRKRWSWRLKSVEMIQWCSDHRYQQITRQSCVDIGWDRGVIFGWLWAWAHLILHHEVILVVKFVGDVADAGWPDWLGLWKVETTRGGYTVLKLLPNWSPSLMDYGAPTFEGKTRKYIYRVDASCPFTRF